ncbi:MAG: hypothetical protein AAGA09_03705 [Pseudomonadota bacterium]
MTTDNPSEASLKTALQTLGLAALTAGVVAFADRAKNNQGAQALSETELAQLQIVLMREAARDAGLDFPSSEDASLKDFQEKLKFKILKTVKGGEDRLKELVCDQLNYCERVGDNWRGKLAFAGVLAMCTAIVDVSGLTLSATLFLLSIGYFDELCECAKARAKST